MKGVHRGDEPTENHHLTSATSSEYNKQPITRLLCTRLRCVCVCVCVRLSPCIVLPGDDMIEVRGCRTNRHTYVFSWKQIHVTYSINTGDEC